MSDEVANKLLDEYMALEGAYLSLRQSYLHKFSKVLSGKRVARSYQIENKVKAIMEYDMMRQISHMK
jgi:hypothetical protein